MTEKFLWIEKQAKGSKVIMVSKQSFYWYFFFKQPKQFLWNNMILNLKIPNNQQFILSTPKCKKINHHLMPRIVWPLTFWHQYHFMPRIVWPSTFWHQCQEQQLTSYTLSIYNFDFFYARKFMKILSRHCFLTFRVVWHLTFNLVIC